MRQVVISIILSYLRWAARLQLRKINPIIIGIGGSSGKSSLGRLIGGSLQDQFEVNTTREKNSETGIPLHILGIHFEFSYWFWLQTILLIPIKLLFYWPKYQILVAEMGIDSPVEPKNMSYLLKIVQPKIAVVTNITAEHSVYFDPFVKEINLPTGKAGEIARRQKILELTAKQETLLLTSLPEDGVAVVNLDDQLIRKISYKIHARQITISVKDSSATLFAKEVKIHPDAFVMEIAYKEMSYRLVVMHPLPSHFAYEFLCAIGVAMGAGLSIQEAIESLQQHFSLPPGRMSIFKGIKKTTIIDSSYNNATIPPILDMLDFLRTLGFGKRKVAIIGDMRELGSQSKDAHEIVAQKILGTANKAILIGPLMRNYALPILKAKKFDVESFDTFTQAREYILKNVKEKDVILVKGSQNTLFLERVVEMLLENEKEIEKLCRRGEFWDKKRAATL